MLMSCLDSPFMVDQLPQPISFSGPATQPSYATRYSVPSSFGLGQISFRTKRTALQRHLGDIWATGSQVMDVYRSDDFYYWAQNGSQGFCNDCAKINFAAAFEKEAWDEVSRERHWVLLQDFTERTDWNKSKQGSVLTQRQCWLCNLLGLGSEMDSQKIDKLVAFDRWLPFISDLDDENADEKVEGSTNEPCRWAPTIWESVKATSRLTSCYVGTLPDNPFELIDDGILVCQDINASSVPGLLEARRPSPLVDFELAKGWIQACNTHHPNCSRPLPTPRIRLIDCWTREVVDASPAMEYVALSYVWGSTARTESYIWQVKLETFPKTIADAITVTKGLGYEYLWIDRYCIKQDDPVDKMEQIQLMELIYQNATLTIVVAAGNSDAHGIPGIQTIRGGWGTNLDSVTHGQYTFTRTCDPDKFVEVSPWLTRGWTFQEGLLSRRRLVFTESTAMFSCQKAKAHEFLVSLENITSREQMVEYEGIISKSVLESSLGFLPGDDAAQNLISLCENVQLYSQRSLTYYSDIFNALRGVEKVFEGAREPIFSIFGIPFIPNDDPTIADLSFSWGLCWMRRVTMAPPLKEEAVCKAPTWCWANLMSFGAQWVGSKPGDLSLLFHPSNIGIQAHEGEAIHDLNEYASLSRQGLVTSEPLIVHCQAYVVSPEAYSWLQHQPQKQHSVMQYDMKFPGRSDREQEKHLHDQILSGAVGLVLLGFQLDPSDRDITGVIFVYLLLVEWSADGSGLRKGIVMVDRSYPVFDEHEAAAFVAEHCGERIHLRLR